MPRGVKNAIIVDTPSRSLASLPKVAWVFIAWVVFCILLFIFLFFVHKDASRNSLHGEAHSGGGGFNLTDASGRTCNVVGLAVHGGLTTYVPSWWYEDQTLSADERNIISSEYISSILDEANASPDVKAVILEVDSGGGSPVAGEEVAASILQMKKPVVGLVRGVAASAAYWALSPAYPIFASQNSDVGGIGVTASYAEHIDEDMRFIELSTGKYKDTGNPDKEITDEEKELIMRDVEIVHNNFIRNIAQNRKLDIEDVYELADGSTMLGSAALGAGLIDRIGSLYDVVNYIKTDVIQQEPVVCWY